MFQTQTGNREPYKSVSVKWNWRLGKIASLLVFLSAAADGQSFDPDPGALHPMPEPWVGGIAPPPPVEDAPMQTPRLLNDTPEYCAELLESIDKIRMRINTIPPQATMLAEEGQRLCQIGHFRPGIVRLRTALMLLRHSGD